MRKYQASLFRLKGCDPMDFHAFYLDVIKWMEANNQMVAQHTNQSDIYWEWVMNTSGYMCDKYDNHPLVKAQMNMLIDYLQNSLKQVAG